jgi:hypothetical protein
MLLKMGRVKSRSFPNMHMIEAEAKGCDNAGKEERLQGGGIESPRKNSVCYFLLEIICLCYAGFTNRFTNGAAY